MAGRHAGTAGRHDVRAQAAQPVAQRVRGEETPVGGQAVRARVAARARDVPGHRVDGLDLTAVPLGRAGVDKRDVAGEQAGDEALAVDDAGPGSPQ